MLQKLAVIGLCLGALLPGNAAFAKPAAGAATASASKSKLDLESCKKALESGDEARALSALDEIELSADRRAAPLIDALLNRGASVPLLLRAMGVAGVLAQESSSSALAPYVKHRAPEVRRAAAQALAHTKGSVAVQALQSALRGSDSALRGTAADGLGTLGAKEAVPDLLIVLTKQVPEAAGAIGRLCRDAECKRFLNMLGNLPFDVMESGILPLLLRTGADVPESVKLQLIERLRRMATEKSSALLSTALATYPQNGSSQIRTAIDAALHGHPVTSTEP